MVHVIKMATKTWPEDFVDKSMRGKSFVWAFQNKKEWVDFTVTEMKSPTGIFKDWQETCFKLMKLEKEINKDESVKNTD